MAYSPNSLAEIIKSNRDRKLSVAKIIESNPNNLPVIPKLIQEKDKTPVEPDSLQINRGILESLHQRMDIGRQNNKNIITLFPDIELAIQIMVSSILSPKKMTETQLNYKLNKDITVSPSVSGPILQTIAEYVEDEHKLTDKLPEIVREALFESGSYCVAVVPEASVDETVNSDLLGSYSAEAFKEKADVLVEKLVGRINFIAAPSNTTPLAVEKQTPQNLVQHMASESFVKLTDNINILRFSEIKSSLTEKLVKRSLRANSAIATESAEKLGYLDVFRDRKPVTSRSNVTVVANKTETRRKSIGKPMVIRIPSESAIPVCIPGNESNHIGYLVLLDENGKPLNRETSPNNLDHLHAGSANTTSNISLQQTPVQTAYRNLVSSTTSGVDVGQMFTMYRDILEQQLFKTVSNSLYGNTADIANKNEIYFLMFSRALANQRTNILFIPKELMVYYSFYYNEFGVGKSLLDNLSVLTSLRAILLFSRVMAQSKQAIDVTRVNVDLDPNDTDPEKTISIIQDSVLKLRQNFFPLGINNPVDLVNWIQRAGLQFAYSNNPLVPNVKIEFDNSKLDHTVPSAELDDSLRKQTIQAMGLSPETVDAGFTPDFAVSVVNNNILLAKRVAIYQKALTRDLTKFTGMLIFNDEVLREKIRKIVIDKIDEIVAGLDETEKQAYGKDRSAFVEDFIDTLSEKVYVELPKPENTDLGNLSAEFKLYVEGLDEVISSVISSDIFAEDIAGDVTAHVETIRNVFKAHLIRQWCATNNYYPEVMEISSTTTEEVDSLIEVISTHLQSTMRNSSLLLTMMKQFKEATNKDLQNLAAGASSDSSNSTPSGNTGSASTASGDATGANEDDTLDDTDGDASGDDLLKF